MMVPENKTGKINKKTKLGLEMSNGGILQMLRKHPLILSLYFNYLVFGRECGSNVTFMKICFMLNSSKLK